MITEQELASASEVIMRQIIDDDDLWNSLDESDRNELVTGMAQELPNMIPKDQQMALRGLIALAVHEKKKETAEAVK